MMTDSMMEELANTITCVKGHVCVRSTIYEMDQDFERCGKTLIAYFKNIETLWKFLRTSLRQSHIYKLSEIGEYKAAGAKSDEYLTNLMDSDTVLTHENPNDAIKRAENRMQRQDNVGGKCVALLDTVEEIETPEVKTLRAEIKAKISAC